MTSNVGLLTVFSPGTRVTLADGVPATIVAVQIWQGGHLVYIVSWWDGRTRKTDTVEPCEITPQGDCSLERIGFR